MASGSRMCSYATSRPAIDPGPSRPCCAPGRRSAGDDDLRVPQNLPQMTIWVPHVPRIASPERLSRLFHDMRSGTSGLVYHRVDFGFAVHVVTEGELGGAGRLKGNAGIARNARPWPEGQHQPVLQV